MCALQVLARIRKIAGGSCEVWPGVACPGSSLSILFLVSLSQTHHSSQTPQGLCFSAWSVLLCLEGLQLSLSAWPVPPHPARPLPRWSFPQSFPAPLPTLPPSQVPPSRLAMWRRLRKQRLLTPGSGRSLLWLRTACWPAVSLLSSTHVLTTFHMPGVPLDSERV